MPIIHTDGIALRYRELGSAEKLPMVFAHSLLWGGDSFNELLRELAKDFHLVIPDIHGHGASGYQDGMTLEQMTEDLYLMLRKMRFETIVWFGCSIGGMMGMRLALAHPEVLDALILLSTNARLDPPEVKEATLHLWKLFRDGHREDIADAAMTFFFSSRTYQERPDLVAQYRAELVGMRQAHGMFAAALAAFDRSDIGNDIGRIKTRTLVMTGREDPAATPAHAEFMATHIPHAQWKIIEDTSHLAGIEKPLEIARVVRDFLAENVA
ncbi:MAG TPA: alpha/beta hydrolase [Nitrospira sp.]|nr:alpha/beta hydrolase [Nitrospira sp.]